MSKVRLDKNGKYILLRFTVDGKRYAISPFVGAKYGNLEHMARAEAKAKRIEADILDGEFTGIEKYRQKPLPITALEDYELEYVQKIVQQNVQLFSPIDIIQLIDNYVKYKSSDWKENTKYDYERLRKKMSKCPYKTTNEAIDITKWLSKDNKGTKKVTLHKHWKLLKAICEYAVTEGRLSENPFNKTKRLLPKISSRSSTVTNGFTINERDDIIKAFESSPKHNRYALLVKFLFFTGCRPNEAISLTWSDIDLASGKVTFNKSASIKGKVSAKTKTVDERVMPLAHKLIEALKTAKTKEVKNSDLVFPSNGNLVISWDYFRKKIWTEVLKTLPDIKYRNPYQMRDTAITLWIEKSNVNTAIIAQWVGNSPQIIARHYTGDLSNVAMPNI